MSEKSNIHFLNGVCERPTGAHSPPVIELCRELLDRAEHGEIVGLAFAAVDPGGSVGTGWRMGLASETNVTMGAQRLAQRLMAMWAKTEVSDDG